MSAFLCSDLHLSTLARLLAKPEHVQDLADKLKRVNIAAVNHRYNETSRATKCKLATLDQCLTITMDDLYRLYQCWDYQACEGRQLEYLILTGYLSDVFSRLGYPEGYQPVSKLWSI